MERIAFTPFDLRRAGGSPISDPQVWLTAAQIRYQGNVDLAVDRQAVSHPSVLRLREAGKRTSACRCAVCPKQLHRIVGLPLGEDQVGSDETEEPRVAAIGAGIDVRDQMGSRPRPVRDPYLLSRSRRFRKEIGLGACRDE